MGNTCFLVSLLADPQNILATNWSTATSVCNWVGVSCGSRNLRVTALDISSLGLTGTIPPHLGNLSFLAWIAKLISAITNSLERFLEQLITLYLGRNKLSGSISSSIINISSLRRINLGPNQLSGSIPTIPRNTSSLIGIGLDTNNLTGEIPRQLALLAELDCSFNKFAGRLPNEIGNLQHLQFFNMGPNNFTGFIPPSLFNSSTLRIISLGVNRLSGHLPLSSEFWLPKLEQIYLDGNELSGPMPFSICSIRIYPRQAWQFKIFTVAQSTV
ncbi:LRR receptor-like serine/threonine-protein kinase EFR [Herrania umbratica]|uniref:LRR receptor-like serine/threonine-protein kinase EFR n=1 Tax=Herrania umbratica TaxID=108875 RepID=A0A6J1BMA1_9ROSI|nr:LRR receptor-like serine/threonine-protein kinase EFR [Herrania umbratica]